MFAVGVTDLLGCYLNMIQGAGINLYKTQEFPNISSFMTVVGICICKNGMIVTWPNHMENYDR